MLLIPIIDYPLTWKQSFLNKHEQKLIKLQSKAQACTSRSKAVKLIRKYNKKIIKMSEVVDYVTARTFTPRGH